MASALRSATPLLLALALLQLGLAGSSPNLYSVASANELLDLTPRSDRKEQIEVTIELEVGGTMTVREGAGEEAKEQTFPMSASAKLVYDEQRVAPVASYNVTPIAQSVRYYKDASAVIKVDKDGATPKLAEERRLIVAQNPNGRLRLAAAEGQLQREELDLIDVVADSLAVDGLLPKQPVGPDATWAADTNAMAAMLSMDSVAAAEVENVLDKFNNDFALVRIAGTIVGTADGSTTEREIRGVYLFDRKLGHVTRCNLAVKEKRSIGGATPGLDCVAKLKVNLRPIESSPHLPAEKISTIMGNKKLQLDAVRLEPAKQSFRVLHDRRWFVTSQERETTTLRCVERGDTLAQCTITALPAKSEANQTTLEEFERDIRFALKQNFGQLVSSRQWNNSFGNHCLEVVVRGSTQEVPLEWHYYLVAPESGPRVSVAVTIQGEMVERLAAADRNLVNAIELLPGGKAAETAAKTETRR
jgi:hypothetical protein